RWSSASTRSWRAPGEPRGACYTAVELSLQQAPLMLAARPDGRDPEGARFARSGRTSASARKQMSPAPGRRPPSILESFNVAFEGIIHVLRTQRNMRIHFLIAVGVLIAALAFDVSKIELIVLLLSIAFVLITEMINTAVEAAV